MCGEETLYNVTFKDQDPVERSIHHLLIRCQGHAQVQGPLTVTTLLDMLTTRRAAADAEIADLCERAAKLADALIAAERERDRWVSAHETVLALVTEQHPDQATDTTRPVTPAYQQILAAVTDAARPLRAKEICQNLEVGTEPRHIEGMRAKLKKLTTRSILTEPSPGLFTLTPPQTQSTD